MIYGCEEKETETEVEQFLSQVFLQKTTEKTNGILQKFKKTFKSTSQQFFLAVNAIEQPGTK